MIILWLYRGRRDRTVVGICNYLYNQCLLPLMFWVDIPLMAKCTWYAIIWPGLSVTCGRLVVFSGYYSFLHQWKLPSRYSWKSSRNTILRDIFKYVCFYQCSYCKKNAYMNCCFFTSTTSITCNVSWYPASYLAQTTLIERGMRCRHKLHCHSSFDPHTTLH